MKWCDFSGRVAMGVVVAGGLGIGASSMALAQAAPAAAAAAPAAKAPPAPAAATATPDANLPEVKPAGPGVFTSQKRGATQYDLVVKGHAFTARDDIEKYLAYRAAELTTDQGYTWFSFIEHRVKGDTEPVPKLDPSGPRYSFRMAFWRPVWRYKAAGSANWTNWSPFAGNPFWANGVDAKKVTDFEVSADIVLHKGMVQDDNPLAFDADALSDYLVNQVEPPQ